jgi:hypothetical protein
MKIKGRFGSEAELISTILEQSLQIHLLESELEKLKFFNEAQKAKLKKAKEELAKNKKTEDVNHG